MVLAYSALSIVYIMARITVVRTIEVIDWNDLRKDVLQHFGKKFFDAFVSYIQSVVSRWKGSRIPRRDAHQKLVALALWKHWRHVGYNRLHEQTESWNGQSRDALRKNIQVGC